MTLDHSEVVRVADLLADARLARRPVSASSGEHRFAMEDAYAIQAELTGRRLARGERIVGWKLGYTSVAMRAQMGIDQPNFGPLTDAMLLGPGEFASELLVQPRVEPEIALRFARAVDPGSDLDAVMAAVAEAVGALEIVDSIYLDYRFTIEDNTADGSSAAQVIVGNEPLPLDRLDEVEVVLWRNGEQVDTATGAAASGHPAAGVVWLVEQLARIGRRLEAGDVVITGGLTRAVPLEPGDRVEAMFDASTAVSVARVL